MMAAEMWWLLILISMAFLAGELGGVMLMGYLMAWRDNSANNRTSRPDKPNRQDAGADGAARSSFAKATEDVDHRGCGK